jgi:hypothetical protein
MRAKIALVDVSLNQICRVTSFIFLSFLFYKNKIKMETFSFFYGLFFLGCFYKLDCDDFEVEFYKKNPRTEP